MVFSTMDTFLGRPLYIYIYMYIYKYIYTRIVCDRTQNVRVSSIGLCYKVNGKVSTWNKKFKKKFCDQNICSLYIFGLITVR